MSQAERLIAIHFIEGQQVGAEFERSRDAWPLHITLMPWFTVYGEGKLRSNLRSFAEGVVPFSVRIGEQRKFGPYKSVPVNVVAGEDNERIQWFQSGLRGAIVRTPGVGGIEIERTFLAHVTRHTEAALNPSDVVEISDFHLVRLIGEKTCHIDEQFILSAPV